MAVDPLDPLLRVVELVFRERGPLGSALRGPGGGGIPAAVIVGVDEHWQAGRVV